MKYLQFCWDVDCRIAHMKSRDVHPSNLLFVEVLTRLSGYKWESSHMTIRTWFKDDTHSLSINMFGCDTIKIHQDSQKKINWLQPSFSVNPGGNKTYLVLSASLVLNTRVVHGLGLGTQNGQVLPTSDDSRHKHNMGIASSKSMVYGGQAS